MANPLLLPLMNWARGLRYPTLFKITAILFAISVLVPDPLPFIDELVLGLGTLLLANWKNRNSKSPPRSSGNTIEGEPPRHIDP
ncbi:DUF6116 family protein [Marilutibacter alkalisoli]|uniref:Transmembrane protein n=1 Tax=Marilutibacter alkalisoli TaxID=2591633 RepID=A0A514BS43_9GAMM|nr:DUF6116 family protein [Lysobacter alkalisoli]QDH70203.1 hypothetical protein FKV23_08930 [Lysobacter alkalisoli]